MVSDSLQGRAGRAGTAGGLVSCKCSGSEVRNDVWAQSERSGNTRSSWTLSGDEGRALLFTSGKQPAKANGARAFKDLIASQRSRKERS